MGSIRLRTNAPMVGTTWSKNKPQGHYVLAGEFAWQKDACKLAAYARRLHRAGATIQNLFNAIQQDSLAKRKPVWKNRKLQRMQWLIDDHPCNGKGKLFHSKQRKAFRAAGLLDFCKEILPSLTSTLPSNFHFHAVIGWDVRAGMENQAGMGKPSVVAEVTAYTKGMLIDTAHLAQFCKKAFHIRKAHVIIRGMLKSHRRVHAHKIIALRGKQTPGLIAQADTCIMGVEQAFAVFFANIDETLLKFIMVGGHSRYLPAATAYAVAAVYNMELHEAVQWLGLVELGRKMRRKAPPHGLVAIDMQHASGALLIGAMPVDKPRRKPMIHMVMGHKQGMNASEPQVMRQRMVIRIWRKINEQFSVYEHL